MISESKIQLKATTRLIATETNTDKGAVIAPAESFKKKNEKDLEEQQKQSEEHENNDEALSDGTSKEKTEQPSTAASIKKASSTPTGKSDGDTSDVMYAFVKRFKARAGLRLLADRLNTESDPLTQDEEDAGLSGTKGSIKSKVKGGATNDGDFKAGFSSPDRMITQDPQVNDYMNVTASEEFEDVDDEDPEEDGYMEPESEVLSDADPRMFGNADQPLG